MPTEPHSPPLLKKDVHISVARLCDHVNIYGKRDATDVIKELEMSRWALDYPSGPNVITRVLLRGGQED